VFYGSAGDGAVDTSFERAQIIRASETIIDLGSCPYGLHCSDAPGPMSHPARGQGCKPFALQCVGPDGLWWSFIKGKVGLPISTTR
jgi:hypothetical protein